MKLLSSTLLTCSILSTAFGKLDVSSEQDQFRKHPADIVFLSLFHNKTAFNQHTSALFKDIEPRAFKAFLKVRSRFVPLLTAKDTAALTDEGQEMCTLLTEHASSLTPAAVSGISYQCIWSITKSPKFKLDSWAKSGALKSISDKVFKTAGGKALGRFNDYAHLLTESQIKAAISGVEAESINVNWISEMSSKQLRLFSAKQFAEMTGWNEIEPNPSFVARLPEYAFSKIELILPKTFYKAMKKAQVEQFGDCQYLRIELLSKQALTGLKGTCFRQYLSSQSEKDGSPEIGRFVIFSDEFLLSNLTAEEARAINRHDWQNFSGEQLQHLPAASCAGIRKSALPADNPFFIPTPACFGKLFPRHQLAFLSKRLHVLPEGTLRHVEKDSIEEWPKKLGTLTSFRLPGSMIQQLGADVKSASQHPCAIMTCIGCVSKAPLVMANMGSSCVKVVSPNLGEDAGPEFYRSILSGVQIAPADIRPKVLRTTHPVTLKRLVSEIEFCQSMNYPEFILLLDAITNFPPSCVQHFTLLGQLKPTELKSLGEAAFEKVDVEAFSKVKTPFELTPLQFRRLGAELEDVELGQHPLNAIPKDRIPDMPLELVAELTAPQLAGMRPSLISAFTKEQVEKLSPSAFRRLREDQFNALRIEACSFEQLSELGSDLPEDFVYSLTAQQRSRLSPTASQALVKNRRLGSEAFTLVPSLGKIFATTLALIFLII